MDDSQSDGLFDGFREECGVFGIFGHPDAANLTYLGLYALQHRGQESAGIASWEGRRIAVEKDMGYVADIFTEARLSRLPGKSAIGHVRYSTAGESRLENAQPIVYNTNKGPLALAHNGNLVNAQEIRQELEAEGAIFTTSSDTEVFLHLMARSRRDSIVGALRDALARVRGAYSVVLLAGEKVIAARDPQGFRPLTLGKLGDAFVVASETCAFDLLDAEPLRDVEPGEIVTFDAGGVASAAFAMGHRTAFCVFEHVYFARPDSVVFGRGVADARRAFGRRLAEEHPAPGDVVVPVPDSGVFASLGFAEASGIPYGMGLVRNHYVGRTFIEPKQSIRHFGVKVKLNAVRTVVSGRKVVLVDDSLVRGTTSRKLVRLLKNAGAQEVHLRISSPPTTNPCYYGIDTPQRKELLAAQKTTEEIREFIEADSLGYLSLEGMLTAAGRNENHMCAACFSGRYPLPFGGVDEQRSLFSRF
ncbi:MAG: amidophosphoribosyltransferase [Acidobacteria bacterium]|nr:amidophosphoribosyltransferase [Acidobacteriota bacterium]MCG3192362.1 Amidophosphoribosyltransferase [Thermoanaerobaculia bacterium]MCK6684725.1 amidophosphoribosyltransferase [Thermoanaerobaculia bacterium]